MILRGFLISPVALLLAAGNALAGHPMGYAPSAVVASVPVAGTRYCINRGGTTVYRQPTFRAPVRRQLAVGRAIQVAQVLPSTDTRVISEGLVLSGDWLKITLDGTPGYVFSSDVSAHRPQLLRMNDGMPYISLLGVRQGSQIKKRQIRVANHNETVADEITRYSHCLYTYSSYDSCFDHVYLFSGLTLAEVYHHLINQYSTYQNGKLVAPKVIAHKGQEFSFTPGLGDADATQEIKLVLRPNNRLEIQTYDCT